MILVWIVIAVFIVIVVLIVVVVLIVIVIVFLIDCDCSFDFHRVFFITDEKRVLERSLANRKTLADELDSKAGRRYTEQTAADLRPMFIEVQVLERGQYFVSLSGGQILRNYSLR